MVVFCYCSVFSVFLVYLYFYLEGTIKTSRNIVELIITFFTFTADASARCSALRSARAHAALLGEHPQRTDQEQLGSLDSLHVMPYVMHVKFGLSPVGSVRSTNQQIVRRSRM
ncbi:unnamed protein product [Microthlaspi erraticum]|uniref:Uncharacterized protein n=1 Tax=Microthlaspi erraticum TaxID=1685480 RepID=A0A6D2HR77_9BRAS|nr:unnamed protein product [Microthlaspi erraticum]